MTPTHGSSRSVRLTMALAALAIASTVLVAIVVSGGPPSPAPSSLVPSPGPTTQVDCTEEQGPLAPGLSGLGCPSAILAVELAVAPVRLSIERIVIEPGPFFCDLIWPGAVTARPCRVYATQPGQFMHAWASFLGSPKVAAVMLGLDLPQEIPLPGQTRPPWLTTLVTVEIPPDGWVMP